MSSEKSSLDLSVIIPFKNKAKMTLTAIDSLYQFGPSVREIILISNNSSNEELRIIRDGIKQHSNIKLIEYNFPFNYQKINNWAVKHAGGKLLLFLNNDTELVQESAGLLEKMAKKAQQPDVGMVGCLLLYGDRKTIQHAGVFLKPGLQGDHLYVGDIYSQAVRQKGTAKYPYDIEKARPLTAVTGAVQLVERYKFDAVSGFNEEFIVCGGDVDLCIRLNDAGFQSWYIPGGYILHKESQSRAQSAIPSTDFFLSYKSYMTAYDLVRGDKFLPKITEVMK